MKRLPYWEVIGRELRSRGMRPYLESRFLPYFVAQSLSSKGRFYPPEYILQITGSVTGKREGYEWPLSGKEFRSVRDAILKDAEDRSYRYFQPEGLINLAKDTGIKLQVLRTMVGDSESFGDMIGDPRMLPERP